MSQYIDDLVPTKHRKAAYAVLGLLALALGVVQVTPGLDLPNWVDAIVAFLAVLGFGQAVAYTRPKVEVSYEGDVEDYALGEHDQDISGYQPPTV